MNSLRRIAPLLRLLILLAAAWLAPLAALGQTAPEPAKEEPGKSYVPGYALTVLAVGLGIFVVVKPGKRRFPKIRRKEDEEEDIKPKH
jgi:hypothetical protein